jgi:hypothetical protein
MRACYPPCHVCCMCARHRSFKLALACVLQGTAGPVPQLCVERAVQRTQHAAYSACWHSTQLRLPRAATQHSSHHTSHASLPIVATATPQLPCVRQNSWGIQCKGCQGYPLQSANKLLTSHMLHQLRCQGYPLQSANKLLTSQP